MSTSAIITIRYSDNVVFAALTIQTDAFLDKMLKNINASLSKLDNDGHRDRLDWNMLATKMIGSIIAKYPKIALLNLEYLEEAKEKGYYIYHVDIIPNKDKYSEKKNDILDSVVIQASSGSGKNILDCYLGKASKKLLAYNKEQLQ